MAKPKIRPNPNLAANLKVLMDRTTHLSSQTQLATRTGVSQSTIGRILRAEVNPSAAALEQIASKFNVEVGDLLMHPQAFYEKYTSPIKKSQDQALGALNRFAESVQKGQVPLLAWEDILATSDPEKNPIQVVCPVPHSFHTFALEIKSLNMYNPTGPVSFQEADRIFVDQAHGPRDRSFVVVHRKDRDIPELRQILAEGSRQLLLHLNPSWPERITAMGEEDKVIGVVIAKVQVLF